MAAGIAAVTAGLGGAAIYAATGHQSSSPFGGPPGQHPMGPPPAGLAAGPGGHSDHHGPPLHGQVVVNDGTGGFVTVLSQSGAVTATTPDSITVRSADGFTQTWATSPDQGSKFGIDDSVSVQGEQAANAAVPTVTEVLDPGQAR